MNKVNLEFRNWGSEEKINFTLPRKLADELMKNLKELANKDKDVVYTILKG